MFEWLMLAAIVGTAVLGVRLRKAEIKDTTPYLKQPSMNSSDFNGAQFEINNALSDWNDDDHNPATGLPMAGGVDIEGNPYGSSD